MPKPGAEAVNAHLDASYLGAAAFAFSAPQIVYGRGASERIAEHLPEPALERPFVLTDRNLREAKVGDAAIEALSAAGGPELYARTPGEPTASEIDEIASAARDSGCSSIVAIGGGASMDSAKCVRVLLALGGSIRDHAGEAALMEQPSVPLVAVPTTSGTGSETGFGALYIDDESRQKTPVYAQQMRPELAISDPDLTLSVPATTTASTGADALAQALGPFTGPLRQPIVDALSREAIRLIVAFLPRAVEDGSDVEARVALAYASLISGMSMNNTEAMADQFIDEVIGPRFRIPHGTVAGVVLPYVVQFNRTEAEERTAMLAEAIVSEPADSRSARADQVVQRLHRLTSEIGLPGLRELGVPESALPDLAGLCAGHYGVDMGINPRELTSQGALAILEAAWHNHPPLQLDC
jgi:alcohol dehydrogenase class IV